MVSGSRAAAGRAVMVANPCAGGARAAGLLRIEQGLSLLGLEVHRVAAATPREVAAALGEALRGESPHLTRVIVAGGDGTIRAALPALIGTRFPMAIVPGGTLNVLARELGIPLQMQAAVGVAASGELREIDLGIADGEPFAAMAGMGYDGAVVHSAVPVANKTLLGFAAYGARGLRLLAGHRPSLFRVATERTSFETQAWLAVVANASRYAYHWRLSPYARVDDGWLDLCLFQTHSAAQTAGQVLSVLSGSHATHPGVSHLRVRELRIEADPPVYLQLDGDPVARTPTQVRILPRALKVVVPPGAAG